MVCLSEFETRRSGQQLQTQPQARRTPVNSWALGRNVHGGSLRPAPAAGASREVVEFAGHATHAAEPDAVLKKPSPHAPQFALHLSSTSGLPSGPTKPGGHCEAVSLTTSNAVLVVVAESRVAKGSLWLICATWR